MGIYITNEAVQVCAGNFDRAAMLCQIGYFTKSNKAQEVTKYLFNERYWVSCTVRGWAKYFPMWKKDKINRTLTYLQDQGLIIGEQIHQSIGLSYTITEYGVSILGQEYDPKCCRKNETTLSQKRDRVVSKTRQEKGGHLIVLKESKKRDNSARVTVLEPLFIEWWEKVPSYLKQAKKKCINAFGKLSDDEKKKVVAHYPEWLKLAADFKSQEPYKYVPRPSTYLTSYRDDELNENTETTHEGGGAFNVFENVDWQGGDQRSD